MAVDLTELQRGVLRVLVERDAVMTPTDIAIALRLKPVHRAGTTWSGNMSPAQRIIGPLRSLRERGLIAHGSRPGDRSGTAYAVTDAGRAIVREEADSDDDR